MPDFQFVYGGCIESGHMEQFEIYSICELRICTQQLESSLNYYKQRDQSFQ